MQNGTSCAVRVLLMNRPNTEKDCEFAVVLLNREGTILDADPSCALTLGWNRDELIGKDVGEFVESGRDLLMEHLLHFSDEEAPGADTSFSVRVIARSKNKAKFPARVTVRRFTELDCWTAAFYCHASELESNLPATVRAEEIRLAARAAEFKEGELRPDTTAQKKAERTPQKDSADSPAPKNWRNSQLLVSSRSRQTAPKPSKAETELKEDAEEISKIVTLTSHESTAGRNHPRESAPASESPAVLQKELEKERAERLRLEKRAASLIAQVQTLHSQLSENLDLESASQTRLTALEEELRRMEEKHAQIAEELKRESLSRKSMEEQLHAAHDLNSSMEASLSLFENVKTTFQRTHEQLEQQLQLALASLKKAETDLEKETANRQRLELSLASAVRQQREADRKHELERSHMEATVTANHLELRRLQEALLRARVERLNLDQHDRTTLRSLSEGETDSADSNSHLRKCDSGRESSEATGGIFNNLASSDPDGGHREALPVGSIASVG
jgi:hypothetical protein